MEHFLDVPNFGQAEERQRELILAERWLFVCSGNLMRSPTAEYVARKRGFLATSCGTRRMKLSEGVVCVPISRELVDWATIIVCMEEEHLQDVTMRFPAARRKPVFCWGIPDVYDVYERRLVWLCTRRLQKTLEDLGAG